MGITQTFGKAFWIFVVQLGLAVIMLWNVGIDEHKRLEASKWPTVRGVVLASSYGWSRSVKGASYWPKVQYCYSVDGQNYHGANLQVGPLVSSKDDILSTIARYPNGNAVRVYYNPKTPSESYLDPAGWPTGSYYMLGVGIVMLLFALLTLGLRFFGVFW